MLSDLLKTKNILFGINAKNKKHLFLELSTKSEQLNKLIDQKTLLEKIIMREKLGNTSISDGIAMPSALLDNIEKTFVLLSILSYIFIEKPFRNKSYRFSSIIKFLIFLILLIFTMRFVDINIFRLLVKFSISSINSFDLYEGSPLKDG